MFYSTNDIHDATRKELIQYLEGCATCDDTDIAYYDGESTDMIREAAINKFETEGC